ncbi:MAG: hypothetical protein QW728_08140 [Thermoplasmata archaeon]
MTVKDSIGRPRYILIRIDQVNDEQVKDDTSTDVKDEKKDAIYIKEGKDSKECDDRTAPDLQPFVSCPSPSVAENPVFQKTEIISIIRGIFIKSSLETESPADNAAAEKQKELINLENKIPGNKQVDFFRPSSLRVPYVVVVKDNYAILKTGHLYLTEAIERLNCTLIYNGKTYRITTLKTSGAINKLKHRL